MPCDLWIEIPHAYSQSRGYDTSFSGSWRRCATFFSPSSIENSRSPIARTISPFPVENRTTGTRRALYPSGSTFPHYRRRRPDADLRFHL